MNFVQSEQFDLTRLRPHARLRTDGESTSRTARSDAGSRAGVRGRSEGVSALTDEPPWFGRPNQIERKFKVHRLVRISQALVVVMALGALTASASSAALPEWAKCVAKAGGKYKDAACQTKTGGGFEKVALTKTVKFTSTSGPGKLETVGKVTVECKAGTSTGEIKSTKEVVKVLVKFTGCETSGIECKTAGAGAGEILTKELKSKLGYINKAKKEVGLSLTPALAKGAFAEFECPLAKATIVVKEGAGKRGNSVIGAITPVNKMAKAFTLTFKQVAGKQSPEKFETGLVDVLESSLNGGAAEQAGLEATDTLTTAEEVELFA